MADPKDNADTIPAPRQVERLVGHGRAELEVLEALRARRFAHAWLISGPQGVGKATFAYRIARFVLAGPDPFARAAHASSLRIPAHDPVARRIAAGAHPDLFLLERTLGSTGKLRTEIIVDDARRATAFLQSTSGEGGWKVLIVDAADELNRNAANALLKIIEEPPGHALALLVAHMPARLPATILSRCRRLRLDPLPSEEIIEIVKSLPANEASEKTIVEAALLAEGSVTRTLLFLEHRAVEFARMTREVLEAPSKSRSPAALKLANRLGTRGAEVSYDVVFDTIFVWLQERARRQAADLDPRAEAAARLWAEIENRKREADEYNLDKRALLITSLKDVAELSP
ncbi:MAG: DNA polymerase III subunit delta' [Hyphomicrobiales bacterium]|nr:DNA polymerase III subunit delta' [Hyphomicrobiales bacterium]MBV9518744.1 DNA polymerase III subunit delta' [Hyphomicrobiales bacterium]